MGECGWESEHESSKGVIGFEIVVSRYVVGLLSRDEVLFEMQYHKITVEPTCMVGSISHL